MMGLPSWWRRGDVYPFRNSCRRWQSPTGRHASKGCVSGDAAIRRKPECGLARAGPSRSLPYGRRSNGRASHVGVWLLSTLPTRRCGGDEVAVRRRTQWRNAVTSRVRLLRQGSPRLLTRDRPPGKAKGDARGGRHRRGIPALPPAPVARASPGGDGANSPTDQTRDPRRQVRHCHRGCLHRGSWTVHHGRRPNRSCPGRGCGGWR
jgi:hypothetical protein